MATIRRSFQDHLNAFCKDTGAYLQGAPGGPLSGLTFAAKDILDVAGYVTGGGNPDWKETHAAADKTAWTVQTLVDAGATMAGKTITDELTRGIFGENAHYGTPTNPRAPGRVPGGSSSGSPRPSPGVWSILPWVPTPAGRCASPPASAGSTASVLLTDGFRWTESFCRRPVTTPSVGSLTIRRPLPA